MIWTPLGFRMDSTRNRFASIDTRYLYATTRHFPLALATHLKTVPEGFGEACRYAESRWTR